MLNLLSKLKFIIPIASILCAIYSFGLACYWQDQYDDLQADNAKLATENASCQASNELLQSSVQRWKAAAVQNEHRLKHTEALVAKRDAESKKKLKSIQQHPFSKKCEQAIHQAVEIIHN